MKVHTHTVLITLYCEILKRMHLMIFLFIFPIVLDGGHNPFAAPPNYHFWAPWIGKNTRQSDTVLNTEFEKVRASKSKSEVLEMTVTEDSLSGDIFKQKVCFMSGSTLLMLFYCINSNEHFLNNIL